MKKLISAKLAGNILIISMILLVIFHILILFKVVPSEIIWGGQIKDKSSIIIYEMIALFISLVFIMIIAIKIDYIKAVKLKKVINIGIWVIFVYFVLNTIGNLASGVSVEKLIFAPITILLTIFAYRLAIEKQ